MNRKKNDKYCEEFTPMGQSRRSQKFRCLILIDQLKPVWSVELETATFYVLEIFTKISHFEKFGV